MKDKNRLMIPAILCAGICLVTLSGNLILAYATGNMSIIAGIDVVFYCNLPICFYFVGMFLRELQQENRELRTRIEELAPQRRGEEHAA
jgi:TRAP-type C4-dicarboxylate transport system permease small subunit